MSPHLILIGFMASGKSAVGRRCAQMLGWQFTDTDRLIEEDAGIPIPRIFADQGEAAFRALELQAVSRAVKGSPRVIATGGGAPTNPLVVERLRASGVVIWLRIDAAEVLRRVRHPERRPLLAGAPDISERVRELLSAREPLYRAASHAIVDSDSRDAIEAARKVTEVYRLQAARWTAP